MNPTEEFKCMLSASAAAEAVMAHYSAIEDFLEPCRMMANVVGMAVGVKSKKGRLTGEPALIVLVTRKLPREAIAGADLIPPALEGMQTDVMAVGTPVALGCLPISAGSAALAARIRPVKGGYSVGHYRITAGTAATCVYDILPGGATGPPGHGTGTPSHFYILSNNHVLANSNSARIGDPILQPGPADGGKNPTDRIARLSRYVPILFEPGTPRSRHHNLVDAAVARGDFRNLDREIYWAGHVRGWMMKKDVAVGMAIQKTGRTTNFNTGRITAVAATIDVGFGAGRVARFNDQILTTNIAAGGDSGALVLTPDRAAVGLLFAGSDQVSIANHIENIRTLLQIEVAEQIL
jgi:hypothetical protein